MKRSAALGRCSAMTDELVPAVVSPRPALGRLFKILGVLVLAVLALCAIAAIVGDAGVEGY